VASRSSFAKRYSFAIATSPLDQLIARSKSLKTHHQSHSFALIRGPTKRNPTYQDVKDP
ncbi:unnamed protein product, partial [Acidithrix sp. C25]